MSKIIIKNIKGLVQASEETPSLLKGKEMAHLPIISNAFIAMEDHRVIDYGKMEDWQGIADWRGVEIIDAEGCFVLPSFCDSHTHTIFASFRETEFIDRLKGLTYEEIAQKGGGILNSAKKLQETSEDELFNQAIGRIEKMIALGTGALEIKSGYGLNTSSEIKMLRVIKRLKAHFTIPIKATFLGAHAFPLEYKSNQEGYVSMIIDEMIPQIAAEGLADFIDVFCERNYFSVDQMQRLLIAGKAAGLTPKVHVNQFSVLGGVKAAVDLGALSVDHLEELGEEDILSLQSSTCVATLLPACSFFLGIPFGDAKRLMEAGLPVSLASDYNPGSSPNYNLFFVWSLACIKMKMTPEEAFNALTINAAYAMGLSETQGKIKIGYEGNLILTKPVPSFDYLPYSFGENNIARIF
ncbi:MAG: imidazolonepropionase [Crocinitomicaceae bacterium]|nr:imidazolonepropionase [Crocinitomicaceae bacterium]